MCGRGEGGGGGGGGGGAAGGGGGCAGGREAGACTERLRGGARGWPLHKGATRRGREAGAGCAEGREAGACTEGLRGGATRRGARAGAARRGYAEGRRAVAGCTEGLRGGARGWRWLRGGARGWRLRGGATRRGAREPAAPRSYSEGLRQGATPRGARALAAPTGYTEGARGRRLRRGGTRRGLAGATAHPAAYNLAYLRMVGARLGLTAVDCVNQGEEEHRADVHCRVQGCTPIAQTRALLFSNAISMVSFRSLPC